MRIGLRRTQCAEAAARVARPIDWLDRARNFLIRIRPFALLAAVPIGVLAGRSTSRPLRLLGSIARWVPMVLGSSRGA
jgi:tRNA (Thr-GGU) A37 N-methylase